MDLLYMSDVLAYQTIRNPLQDKYTWDPPPKCDEPKAQPTQKKNKTPCKICQEKQRRSLLKYIRSKSHDHSDQNILEEEEEEEKEGKTVQTNKRENEKVKC